MCLTFMQMTRPLRNNPTTSLTEETKIIPDSVGPGVGKSSVKRTAPATKIPVVKVPLVEVGSWVLLSDNFQPAPRFGYMV